MSVASPPVRPQLDKRGRVYQPAVSPRLKKLLLFIFGAVALLGANSVYLSAVKLWEALHPGAMYQTEFSQWMFFLHLALGVLLIVPFLTFAILHMRTARQRPNRRAVRAGYGLFTTSCVLIVTGLVLWLFFNIDLEEITLLRVVARPVVYWLHVLSPLVAIAFYIVHRRAGPAIKWKWGWAWAGSVAVLVAAMGMMHSQNPRLANRPGADPEYFHPSLAATSRGNFIAPEALMMDRYCLQCHPDVHAQWSQSAHRFSSFNNLPYRFAVLNTRRALLEREERMAEGYEAIGVGRQGTRWCAGCHDPVPLFSGAFDRDSFFDTETYPNLEHEPTAHAGITCTVCHSITSINSLTGNGDYVIEEAEHYPFAFSTSPMAQWINRQLIMARPDMHRRTFMPRDEHGNEILRNPAFCSVCHKVGLPPEFNDYQWLRGQNHWDTWHASGVSGYNSQSFYHPPRRQDCADCHMELVGSNDFGARLFDDSGRLTVHDHRFLAANTALPFMRPDLRRPDGTFDMGEAERAMVEATTEFLQRNRLRIDIFALRGEGREDGALIGPIRPELPELEPGEDYLLEVVVRILTVGHVFTQGTADSNEVWVEVEARAGDPSLPFEERRLIGASGQLDEGGYLDRHAHRINALVLDQEGRRIDRRNPEDIFTTLYNHQIPPGAADVMHYLLEVPEDVEGPIEIRVAVQYRKFDRTYMDYVFGEGQGPELPVVEMASDAVVLPVGGTAGAPGSEVGAGDAGSIGQASSATQVAAQERGIEEWERFNDYGIALFLKEQGHAQGRQAEEAFRRVIELRPDWPEGYINLARVLYAEGTNLPELRRVLAGAERVLEGQEFGPSHLKLAWLRGRYNQDYGEPEDLDSAIADFRAILNARFPERGFDFGQDRAVRFQLAMALYQRSQQAVDLPAETPEDEPIPIYERHAERQRFLEESVQEFRRVLEIDPEAANAHYQLMRVYRSLAALEQAVLLEAEDPRAGNEVTPRGPHDSVRLPDAEREELQARIDNLRAAVERDPGDLDARHELMMAYQSLADLHDSLFQRFEIDPNAGDRAVEEYLRNHPWVRVHQQAVGIYDLTPEQ